MPDAPRILLVSPDLMVGSRLAGLASGCGLTLDTVAGLNAPPPASGYRVAILDLQGLRGDVADLVTRARACLTAHGAPAVIAFGPHVAVDRLAAARAAGADDVVSRGELLGAFATIVARHCG